MRTYSIQDEVLKFNPDIVKVYYYLYADSGFELGFGKAGKYSGHSHKYFSDILFSKKQISTTDADGKIISGNLIIIPPKTYLGEVIIDDFFFLKISPTNTKIILPDKIENVLSEGKILCYSNSVIIEIPWFKNYLSNELFLTISFNEEFLKIQIGETTFIIN